MTRSTDPAFEIRSALDREAGRRLDVPRLAAALARARAAGAPPSVDPRGRSRGPLERMPASVQWIGVAAATIAAVLGLRSLYLEWTVPPTAGGASRARPAPTEDLPRPGPEPEPASPLVAAAEPAPRERAAPPPTPVVPRSADALEPGEPVGSDKDAAPAPATMPSPPTLRRSPPARRAVVVPDEPRSADPAPSRSAGSTSRAPRDDAGPVAVTVVGATSPPPPRVRGVRVASVRAGREPVVAVVVEIARIGATLVTVRGSGSTPAAVPRRFPDVDPHRADAVGAGDDDAAVQADQYYARLLLGASFEAISEDEHGILGTAVRVVPFRDEEAWGTESQRRFLRGVFDTATLVPADGVQIPGPVGDATWLVGLGGRLFEVSIHATPEVTEGVSQLELKLSHVRPVTLPQARARLEEQPERPGLDADQLRAVLEQESRGIDRLPRLDRGRSTFEGTLLVETGHVAIIAIPDALLTGYDSRPSPSGADTLFLVVSPRSTAGGFPARPGLQRLVEQPDEPPILVDGETPVLPEDVRRLGVGGAVTLKAVVLEDGSVGAVQVTGIPDVPGAEYLIEIASGAVRHWHYLPARERGSSVPSYVTIQVAFEAPEQ